MKMNWWNSLRTKIIAWSFVPTVIILSAVAWFTFYSYQKVIGDLAIKQDWAVVQSRTHRSSSILRHNQSSYRLYYPASRYSERRAARSPTLRISLTMRRA